MTAKNCFDFLIFLIKIPVNIAKFSTRIDQFFLRILVLNFY